MVPKYRVIVDLIPTPQRPARLSDSERNHLLKVLRLKNDDRVFVIDRQGASSIARIQISGPHVDLHHAEQAPSPRGKETQPVTLEACCLKNDSMSWVIEKATELGIEYFQPVLSKRTVMSTKNKGADHFLSRWTRIAEQAMKQCERTSPLKILPILSLDDLISRPLAPKQRRLWCDENRRDEPNKSSIGSEILKAPRDTHFCLLVGPEGGWSGEECDFLKRSSATPVSLGPLVLRAETAAIYAMASCASLLRVDTEILQARINNNEEKK